MIIFYEKPGCGNNTRQKRLLVALGFAVDARNLLTEPWTPEALKPFFAGKPLWQWFNPAAPRIKSGEVVPENVESEQMALAMMMADPYLIRRPLMQAEKVQMCGFDAAEVEQAFGLEAGAIAKAGDIRSCRQKAGHGCRTEETTEAG